MEVKDDSALLRQYCDDGSDDAFAQLVTRHINLVYSVALRQAGNPHQAEEITQAVFIILAKKAHGLRHDKALSSWLFQTTHLTSKNFVRSEMRRLRREQEAFMQSMPEQLGSNTWEEIIPLLDTAVASLKEKDRRAVVLRFYQTRSLREVGSALGMSEEAAKKRVARALGRLQRFFSAHGVNSTTAIIAETISAHSVHVAPAALAKSVAALAVAKDAAASTSTLTLVKGALKVMAWTKAKTVIVASTCLLLVGGTATLAIKVVSDHGGLIQGKTEAEWIKGIAYYGDDKQLDTWQSLGSKGVRMLMRALNSPTNDHPTRMCVASLLNQLSSQKQEYFPELIETLTTEKDESVRAIEIACFDVPNKIQKIPEKAKARLFPELLRALDSNDCGVRNNALVNLQYYPDRKETVVPLMKEKLEDPIPGVRVMAVEALRFIDPQNSAGADLVAVLAKCVTDPPGNMPNADNNAVVELGDLHYEPDVAIPVLVQALQSPNVYVRQNSAHALGRFGIEARGAIEALTKATRDSDAGVRNQAAAALRKINSGAGPQ